MTIISNFNFSGNMEADAEALRQEMIKLAKEHNMNMNQFIKSYKEFSSDPNLSPKDTVEKDLCTLAAKMYRNQLRYNIKNSLKSLWEDGWWTFKAPLGYLNYRDKNGRAQIKVDSDCLQKIYKLFLARRDGASLEDLYQLAKDMKLKFKRRVISKNHILRILHNRFYEGKLIVKHTEYQHKYPIMVPPELFEEVQQTFRK